MRAGKQAVIASRRASEYRSQRAAQQKRQEEGDEEYGRQKKHRTVNSARKRERREALSRAVP